MLGGLWFDGGQQAQKLRHPHFLRALSKHCIAFSWPSGILPRTTMSNFILKHTKLGKLILR